MAFGAGCSSPWGQEEEDWKRRGEDVGAASLSTMSGEEWLVVGRQVTLRGFGGSGEPRVCSC